MAGQPKTRRRQAATPFTRGYRLPRRPSRSRSRKIASNSPGGARRGPALPVLAKGLTPLQGPGLLQ